MADICNHCHGSGAFFVCQEMPEFKNKHPWFHWITCVWCSGVGTVRVHSAPFIKMHSTKGLKKKSS